jgi:acetylornithine deacetylase/succinyl-diaminopimelate desuccinylase-like protein
MMIWLVLAILLGGAAAVRAQEQNAARQLARDIFKQLIEIDTTDSKKGNVTTAAEAMAKRLREAGFPEKDIIVDGPSERKKNMVARIHGTGKRKPVLFIGHLDVVEALKEDWTTDPFQFIEKDGYYYGRGATDMKNGDAILMANFIRLKQEGYQPDRDLILALTADEEGGDWNGVDWLVKKHRDWIDSDYCINLDGGDFTSNKGNKLFGAVQAAEKVYVDIALETRNPGGHSSRPTRDNAIYHLAEGLARLSQYSFPAELNEITRAVMEKGAAMRSGQEAADMKAAAKTPPDAEAIARLSENATYNALLRTTCVATMVEGGHARNALPQRARANVNCRLLPGTDPRQVLETIERVVADPQIHVSFVEQKDADGNVEMPVSVPPSPLRPDLMAAIEKTTHSLWPGLPILPEMSTGASDGKFLRMNGIPTYGISAVFLDLNEHRAHGQDERVPVESFYDAVEFNYRLVKEISSAK